MRLEVLVIVNLVLRAVFDGVAVELVCDHSLGVLSECVGFSVWHFMCVFWCELGVMLVCYVECVWVEAVKVRFE